VRRVLISYRRQGTARQAHASHAVVANPGFELFVSALSVLSLVNILLVLLVQDPSMQNVIYSVDALLSLIFMVDFLVRLHRAPSRYNYLFRQFGWADLLACLPLLQVKILRIFRLFRVVRLLRSSGSKNIGRSLVGIADRAHC